MQGGKAAGQAPRFLSASGPMAQPCRPSRQRRSAAVDRAERRTRLARWADITGSTRAASASGRYIARSGKRLLVPGDHIISNNLTMPADVMRGNMPLHVVVQAIT